MTGIAGRSRTFRAAFISTVIAIVLSFFASTTQAPAAYSRPSGKLVPKYGTLFGAYVDPDNTWVSNDQAKSEVTSFESSIGRKLAVDQHYYGWNNVFPSGLEQWDLHYGRIPMITWQGTTLTDITNGSQDDVIRARADGVRSLGKQVFVRWGWEMNGDWYDWSGSSNGSSTNAAMQYRAAWRRIHTIFVQQGATNAVWVWAPNHESVPNTSWNSWRNYYPGDTYVDWVGIDGYNWGATRSWSKWKTFDQIFGPVYNDYAKRKPMMIAEFSSVEKGGSKSQWIAYARSAIRYKYTSIAAVLWFDVPKEADWRPMSSSPAMSSYKTFSQDSYFRPANPLTS